MMISVAMATYNGERFIGEQLASLAVQTRLPDELIVSDDASNDRTLEIVDRFARTAPFRVRIHRNERNRGFSDNFLLAATLCSGDWIAYCDQDDVWLPDKISTLERYTSIPGRHVLAVAHNADVVDESLTPSGVRYLSIKRPMISRGERLPNLWVASGFTLMFRADLVSRIPYQDRGPDPDIRTAKLAHDVWISRLARILGDVVILPTSLALYRRHVTTTSVFLSGGNQQVRNSRKWAHRLRRLSKHGADTYESHSQAALAQALAFGRLAQVLDNESWRARFLRAECDYRDLSMWLKLRSCMYREKRLPLRMWYLCRLMAANGHIRFNGYSLLNAKAMLRELLFDIAMSLYGPR